MNRPCKPCQKSPGRSDGGVPGSRFIHNGHWALTHWNATPVVTTIPVILEFSLAHPSHALASLPHPPAPSHRFQETPLARVPQILSLKVPSALRFPSPALGPSLLPRSRPHNAASGVTPLPGSLPWLPSEVGDTSCRLLGAPAHSPASLFLSPFP